MAKEVERNPFVTTEAIVNLLNEGFVPFIEIAPNSTTLALETTTPIHIRVDVARVVG